MAKATYDQPIDKNTSWDGDDSTGNLPVRGTRVEEFVKGSLNSKAGEFYYDSTNNRYLVFADSETRDEYLADPTKVELIIGTFDAPFNYSAKITLETPTYNAIALGSTGNYIDFTFEIENKSGQPTGESVICTYTFRRGSVKQTVTEQYAAGRAVHFNVDKYLSEGTNNVTVAIQGTTSLAAITVAVTYQVVNLTISSSLDIAQVYDLASGAQVMAVPFSVSGYGTKTVEWYLDDTKLDFVQNDDEVVDVSVSRTKYIALSNLSHGVHRLQIRAYTVVGGEEFFSDTLYREIIVSTGTSKDTVIAVSMSVPAKYGIIQERKLYGIIQYVPYSITFATYTPTPEASADVDILLNDTLQGAIHSENGVVNEFVVVPAVAGAATISFVTASGKSDVTAEIEKSTMNLSEITDALQLDFRAIGKTNNATDKDSWQYGAYIGTFEGFHWNSTSGWVDNALHINTGASFGINLAPLAKNPSILGKTIEVEFATTNVRNDDAVICDLRNENGTGLLITATKISLTSDAGVTIDTPFKDGEYNRFAIVINKAAGTTNKCMSFIYANGIVSRGASWASTDNYTSDKAIVFRGSDDAEIKLKSIRIYDAALTSDQVLNNFTLYRDSVDEMNEVYERNDVYSEGANSFDYEKMMSRLPVMIVTGNIPVLENTSDKNEQITVDIDYFNLQDPTKSFSWKSAALRPQGTSSMGYPKKNFRPYSNKLDSTICYDANGRVVPDRLYAFKEHAQRVDCWCLKADYAESSGTHNTGIARLWNQVLFNATLDGEYRFRTEAQKAALFSGYEYDVRTTIDGFPILLFYRLTADDPLVFIGKYNFNNDKSTPSVFGFEGIPGFNNRNMQCWEVLNNGNALALFTTAEGFDEGWAEAFESRYPDTKNPDTSALKAFCQWMSSVSQANFATQKWEHLNVYMVAAYYIYLMRFGAVDQTVKNAMLTSEDGQHFFFINYDNDTINGLINTGRLLVPWNADRTTIGEDGQPYYAGSQSRLWNMLEADDEFVSIVRLVDEALYTAGLKYEDVIKMFDDEQANKWVERVYNQDAQYKYIGPYVERGVNNLFMLQGDRTTHRRWWLARRFNYFDSKFISGAYKAQAIEIKCINNTPAGQRITVTAGTAMDYGYGINSVPREGNVTLAEGESHTFVTKEVINLGDPIRVYAAPNIKGLDLSAMAGVLAVVTIDKVNDTALGTKLTHLILGNASVENVSVTEISGLAQASKLEYLDVRNMKGMTSLNLTNQPSIQFVDARGSGVSSVELARGAALQILHMSSAARVLNLVQLPYLVTLSSENDFASITTMIIKKCPLLGKNFSFVHDWVLNAETAADVLTLEMDDVVWDNITADALIEVGRVGNKTLSGKASLVSITPEQARELKSLYGEDCFTTGAGFFIGIPDTVVIGGAVHVREGKTAQYTAEVLTNYPGKVVWSIVSGGTINQSISTNGLLSTKETGSTRTIVIRATHTASNGVVAYADYSVSIDKTIRPTSGTISGSDVVVEDAIYTLSLSPTNTNEPYTVEWSVVGDGATKGYIGIKEKSESQCTVQLTSENAYGLATLQAKVVCENGLSFVVSKALRMGIMLTIALLSNQAGDTTLASAQATITFGGVSLKASDGQPVNVPASRQMSISFSDVAGYKTPESITITTGKKDMTQAAAYYTEVVSVTLKSWDNGNIIGQTIIIDGVSYTWRGVAIERKVAYNRRYAITTSETEEYVSPNPVEFTASQISRDVTLTYTKAIRPTGGVISGADELKGETAYSLTLQPDGINKPYTVEWSLSGEGATTGYAGIMSSNLTSCVVQLLSSEARGSIVLNANVTCGSSVVTVSKALTMGVLFTLSMSSNQAGDTTLNGLKATISFGSTSMSVTNGETVSVPRSVSMAISFPAVDGYLAPAARTVSSGTAATSLSVVYQTEIVNVTLSATNGASVDGQKVTINGTSYTWDGVAIKHKVAYRNEYTISVDEKLDYVTPALVSFTASQISRDVALSYTAMVFPNNVTIEGPDNPTNSPQEYTWSTTTVGVTGKVIAEWTLTGDITAYKKIASSDNQKCSLVTTDAPMDIISGKLSIILRKPSGSILASSVKDLRFSDPNIIMTSKSNPVAMAIMYNNGLAANSSYMTKDEAAAVTADQLQPGSSYSSNIFYSQRQNFTSFDEFQYFTGVTSIKCYTFQSLALTSIVIPCNVDTIENNAFSSCSSLTSIEIPNSVTSIERYAFSGCSSLTSIEIPNSVTSIGDYAFDQCSSLTSIEISSRLTSIGDYAFRLCSGLTSVEISSRVTSIEIGRCVFTDCPNLTSIVVNPENQYYDSRDNCNAIIQISTNSLIVGCRNTKIPNSVTSIERYAFSGCSSLTSIEIPNSVTSIGDYAFDQCSSLTSIEIPNSVTSIGDCAFQLCSDLTSVEISSRLTSIGNNVFYWCESLESVIIPSGVTTIVPGMFYNCTGLTSIEIPNSVTSIERYAFSGCSSLTSIEIPNSVTSIGQNVFYNCLNLSSITCLRREAPKLILNAFGSSEYYYTGRNTYNKRVNRLYVPAGATGYNTGYWLDPLCNSSKCGFTVSYTL